MLEILKFIFQSEWHFFGTLVLLYISLLGLQGLAKAIRRKG